eukprot:gene20227-biopygen10097
MANGQWPMWAATGATKMPFGAVRRILGAAGGTGARATPRATQSKKNGLQPAPRPRHARATPAPCPRQCPVPPGAEQN